MPVFQYDDVSLYYEEYGSGYPVLLFAAGALDSSIEYWRRKPRPSPFDPTVELAAEFRLIAMDQRNAGRSRAPITAADGWETYARDHLALLDHLGVERAHVMGACIGSSYCLGLIKAQPARVTAAVLQQPIGLAGDDRSGSYENFAGWAAKLRDHPEATPAVLDAFAHNLYESDFVYSVSRDFARACQTPLLVLPGDDRAHPREVAEELARIAPNAELIPQWREGPDLVAAVARIRQFLLAHTPTGSTIR